MPIGTRVLFRKTVVGMLMLPPFLVEMKGMSPVPKGKAFLRPSGFATNVFTELVYRPPSFRVLLPLRLLNGDDLPLRACSDPSA